MLSSPTFIFPNTTRLTAPFPFGHPESFLSFSGQRCYV